jgi:hypothetical protein
MLHHETHAHYRHNSNKRGKIFWRNAPTGYTMNQGNIFLLLRIGNEKSVSHMVGNTDVADAIIKRVNKLNFLHVLMNCLVSLE